MPNSFSPLIGESPKVLILGSMPGGESLRKSQYYAYKQNRFWSVMFALFSSAPTDDYEERCQLLKDNGIALWDSIKECDRENSSLDSKIKNEVPNDIEQLTKENPSIKAIITNGAKSGAVFVKSFPNLAKSSTVSHITLPSTSPANAATNFERLYEVWSEAIRKHL